MAMSHPGDNGSPFSSVRYMLDVDAVPGLLPRLLQPFAKRDLTPDRMWSHRTGSAMHVEIACEAMPNEVVHLVEGNLMATVGVHNVTLIRARCLREVA